MILEFLKNNPTVKYILIGAIILVILFFALRQIKGPDAELGTKEYKDDKGNTIQFNPRPYTDNLYSTITSYLYAYSDKQPYLDLLNLNDIEFKLVAQDWNKRIYNKKTDSFGSTMTETLRAAIYNEYGLSSELQSKLLKRFSQLNIS